MIPNTTTEAMRKLYNQIHRVTWEQIQENKMNQSTNTTSYVYDNVEVIKTGRSAQRKTGSGKLDELIEITPTGSPVNSWKKWVRESELYEVRV